MDEENSVECTTKQVLSTDIPELRANLGRLTEASWLWTGSPGIKRKAVGVRGYAMWYPGNPGHASLFPISQGESLSTEEGLEFSVWGKLL